MLDEVGLLTVARSDGLEACLTVHAARRWHGLPVRATRSWVHDQCLLGTPLAAGERSEGALTDLLLGLRESDASVFAELDWIDRLGPVGGELDAALPSSGWAFGAFSRAALERRPEPTYTEGRIKGKHRRSLRRLGRELAEHLGGELSVVDRAGEDRAVDQFIELEAAGWKARAGTDLAGSGQAGFFREICRRFSGRGALQLLFLEAEGTVAAARCSLRAGRVLFCFKVAFDERLRRFSPGTQLELRVIDRFHADQTLDRMDSCAASDSELFNRLWPDRRSLQALLLPSPGLRGAAVRPILRAATRAIGRRREDASD